ncbi:DUF6897 domain-containing protein [Clostridium sp. DL1XJH146]
MNTVTWIAIYMPLFILFFIILPQQRQVRKVLLIKKKRMGLKKMTNEILQKYIGTTCTISTGSFGTALVGEIITINENWIEVQTKKGIELINAEFVQSIKIKK